MPLFTLPDLDASNPSTTLVMFVVFAGLVSKLKFRIKTSFGYPWSSYYFEDLCVSSLDSRWYCTVVSSIFRISISV